MATFTIEQAMSVAEQAHASKDYARAIDLTDAILKLKSGHASALHLNGAARFMSGDRMAGLERVRAARRLAPDAPQFIRTLADMLLVSGQPEQALGILRGGLARKPNAPELWQRYAKACEALGDTEAAAAALKRSAC
jgi:predicted Zn-dependent protease